MRFNQFPPPLLRHIVAGRHGRTARDTRSRSKERPFVFTVNETRTPVSPSTKAVQSWQLLSPSSVSLLEAQTSPSLQWKKVTLIGMDDAVFDRIPTASKVTDVVPSKFGLGSVATRKWMLQM